MNGQGMSSRWDPKSISSRLVIVVAEGEGGYAEYAKITAHNIQFAQHLPDDVTYEEGTFVEPLADCLHAVRERANVIIGERVVVVGAGPMGLGILLRPHVLEAMLWLRPSRKGVTLLASLSRWSSIQRRIGRRCGARMDRRT